MVGDEVDKPTNSAQESCLWSVAVGLGWSGIGQAQELVLPNEQSIPASASVETPAPMSPGAASIGGITIPIAWLSNI